MDHNKIGNFIASLRKEKGWTQQDLGEKLFVTNKAVSKWERGLSLPDISILEKLASLLGVDVSELLRGERGTQKVDIEEELHVALEQIKQHSLSQKKKNKKELKKIFWIFFSIITPLLAVLLIYEQVYHPKVIHEGDNRYLLGHYGSYNLEKNGLNFLTEIIQKTDKQKEEKSNISSFQISLHADGTIQSFTTIIYYFNDNLTLTGTGRYSYQKKNLNYTYEEIGDCKTVSDCEIQKTLIQEYMKSRDVEYISETLKRIPFQKQIKKGKLKNFIVTFGNTMYFRENTPVIDLRNHKKAPALSLEEYKQGKGGSASPGIYLDIILSDGSSTVAEEVYHYIFDPIKEDPLKLDYTMQTDYYINNGKLQFTRDYGNTWIDADITKEQVGETLTFYRDKSLLSSSWFLSENPLIPIAYFYGKNPKLKISTDNGKNWVEKEFQLTSEEFAKPVTHRVVGFTDQNFGYAALGTDWSMGSGEEKKAYLTKDSGSTWEEIELPLNVSSHTLMDFIMLDFNVGVVALKESNESQFPLLYATTSGGKSWTKVEYLSTNIPDSISYLTSLDQIKKEDDQISITLGQGDSGTTKAIFTTKDMFLWNFKEQKAENIHTVG